VLDAGPAAVGWADQRWTLVRVRDLIAARFKVPYTIPGTWYLLRRRGWSCQLGARRAAGRDDGAIGVWKEEGDLAAGKRTAAPLGGWIVTGHFRFWRSASPGAFDRIALLRWLTSCDRP